MAVIHGLVDDHMLIYCCGCESRIDARLTDGGEVYPHRPDLRRLPFWKCDTCGNFVGCHHKTANRTAPLGCIPTPEIRGERKRIHSVLDPIWKNGTMSRAELYAALSERLGRKFHTANIRSVEEAREVYSLVQEYASVAAEESTGEDPTP